MDVDTILPAHGDVATRADVKELAAMLADEYATVKDAVNRRLSLDQATATLTFPQYKDWRNYGRLQGDATTANMVPDCNARAMSVIAMNSKGHG
jgi:hypothetical protein